LKTPLNNNKQILLRDFSPLAYRLWWGGEGRKDRKSAPTIIC